MLSKRRVRITARVKGYLGDGGQFDEQHLEHWRRDGLLKNLEELLRLTTYRDRVGQVIHTVLKFTWLQKQTKKKCYHMRRAGENVIPP